MVEKERKEHKKKDIIKSKINIYTKMKKFV